VHELDDLGGFLVEVSLFICLFVDILAWEDKFADVDTSGTGLLLDKVNQLL